jgi:hypothetical protein
LPIRNKKGHGAAPQWEIRVSFMRMGGAVAPQQLSPVLYAACARQKTHAAACHSFTVGCIVFSTSSKNQYTPPEWGA